MIRCVVLLICCLVMVVTLQMEIQALGKRYEADVDASILQHTNNINSVVCRHPDLHVRQEGAQKDCQRAREYLHKTKEEHMTHLGWNQMFTWEHLWTRSALPKLILVSMLLFVMTSLWERCSGFVSNALNCIPSSNPHTHPHYRGSGASTSRMPFFSGSYGSHHAASRHKRRE